MTATEYDGNMNTSGNALRTLEGEVKKLIRTNVRDIRLAKGITGSYVARALAISRQGYQSMENGQCEISSERLKEISKVLNVKPAVFFERKLTESVIKRIGRRNVEDE